MDLMQASEMSGIVLSILEHLYEKVKKPCSNRGETI